MNKSKRLNFLLSGSILLVFIASVSARKPEADMIIYNGRIHTIDRKLPEASAVAVRDGKIIAVVKKDYQIQKYIGKKTVQINARGQLVLPGFNDSHVHFMGIGNLFSTIDLKNIRNPQKIADELEFYTRFIPKGHWILGGGWDNNLWDSKQLPTKDLIDDATWEYPVFLYNRDATMALVNTRALKLANIDKNKDEIEGGVIVRDEKGEPTGVLKGNAMLFVKAIAPQIATKQYEDVAEAATNYAAFLGITSVQDMHSDYLSDVLNKLQSNGKLKTRVYDCTPLEDWKKLADRGIKHATGTDMIRTGCLKSFTSGYPEEESQLYEYISNADKHDLQVMIHAIGSRANSLILSVYERVIAEDGVKDRRFRVEHAFGFRPEDMNRYSRSRLITSLQPHLFGSRQPLRSLMRSYTAMAFGSDASITDFNPLYGIQRAVMNGDESVSVEQAVYFYTQGAAYAEFQENVKGSVTVGKLGDFVILSDDIFEIKPEKISDAEVVMTILGGRIVYNRREYSTALNFYNWPRREDLLDSETQRGIEVH